MTAANEATDSLPPSGFGWLNPLHHEGFLLRTELAPEACEERLAARLTRDRHRRPVVPGEQDAALRGDLTEGSFGVWRRTTRDVVRVLATGGWRREGTGAWLAVRLQLNGLGRGLGLALFAFVVVTAAYLVGSWSLLALTPPRGSPSAALFALEPLALAVSAATLFAAQTWVAWRDAPLLLGTLRELLDAEEISGEQLAQ